MRRRAQRMARAAAAIGAAVGAALIGSIAIVVVAPAWSVHDKTPPQTTITSGPASRTTDTTPSFHFSSSEKNSRFVCKRDGKRFSACSSPKTLKPLAYGRHGFYVRAIDPFFNKDPTAAAYTFKVVRP